MTEREMNRLARRVAERFALRLAREIVAELHSDGNLGRAEVPSRVEKEGSWRDVEKVLELSDPTNAEEHGDSSSYTRRADELITRARRKKRRAR